MAQCLERRRGAAMGAPARVGGVRGRTRLLAGVGARVLRDRPFVAALTGLEVSLRNGQTPTLASFGPVESQEGVTSGRPRVNTAAPPPGRTVTQPGAGRDGPPRALAMFSR